MKQVSSVKSSKLNGFLLALFFIQGLVQNLALENLALKTMSISCFMKELTFLSQNWYFFQKL